MHASSLISGSFSQWLSAVDYDDFLQFTVKHCN